MGLNTRFFKNILPVCCQILYTRVIPQPYFNLFVAPIVLPVRAGSVLIGNRNSNMSTSKETGSQKTKGNRRSALKSAKPVKIEYEQEEEEEDKKPAKRVRQRQEDKEVDADVKKEPKSPKVEASETIEPANWRQVVENIREMRVDNPAPVDTMGCERTADDTASPEVKRFQTLISLLLSSQTKDGVTFAAMGRLKDYGCTPEKMLEIPESDLKAMLNPVGFYNKKAANIKKVSQILLDKYGGDIPKTSQGLMELPGIGPKMAYICMQVAWGVNEGIGVDTHVHRISERLGWTSAKEKKKLTPEDTRKQLESWLPKDMWQDVNILLVGFGQTICNPTAPKCNECLNKSLCPFGRKNSKSGQGPSKTK